MDSRKIKILLKKGEGTKIDYKLKIDLNTDSGRKELAKDICAIANSRGGRGYLIVGVEDKTRKVIGVENIDFTEEQIQQIVSSRCDPPIPVSIEFINYESKKLLVINIYDGPQKPYQLRDNGAFYIRRGSTTDIMRKQELVSAFEDNLLINPELCPIVNSNVDQLNYELVDRYFHTQGIKVDDKNRISLMENASIINLDKESNNYLVTLGGLLVFSQNNNVYIPHNMIKIVNVNSKRNENQIITGDLLSILNSSEKIISQQLQDEKSIEAVNEAIRNAVLFRDYALFNREIEVIFGYTKIYIIIPGAFSSWNNSNYISINKRNMWIYEKLLALDYNKRLYNCGTNLNYIKKLFSGTGKVIFVNGIKENSFKIVLPKISRLTY